MTGSPGDGSSDGTRPPVDARLVLPALAAWAGAFLGTAGAWWAGAALLAVGGAAWVTTDRLVGRTSGLAALAALTLLAGGLAVGGAWPPPVRPSPPGPC